MKSKFIHRSIFSVLFVMFTVNISLFAQTTVVKGKLLDVEGNPSKYALVGIASSPGANGQDFVSCDAKGNYSIKLTKPGQNFLMFSIPSHRSLSIPVQNNKNKEFTIDVTLAPYKYKDNFENIGVAGTFNDFNIRSPEKMVKREDGTYTFEVKSYLKEIKFQLCGIEKDNRTINAPESVAFEPDSSGDYRSIINVNAGKATIVFDPSKLLKKDSDNKVAFTGSDYDEKIFKFSEEYSKISSDAVQKMRAHMDAKKNPQGFQYDGGNFFTEILKKIDSEKDLEFKDYLKLIYVSFSSYKPKDYSFEKATSFFESLSPENAAWELMPSAFFSYYFLVPQFKWNELQDKFLKDSKSNSIKISVLTNKLAMAKFSGNKEELIKLHTLIANDYKEVKEAQDLLKKFPIESKIKVGVEIPDFEVISIDNPTEKHSKQSMLGKIYMIDFWATWCGPCVGEMEILHKVYDKFKDKGFELLSLSLDAKSDDVIKFRNDKWKMPWKNSFIGDTDGRKIADKFEVIGIPRPILVSAEGKILEMEGDLRGDKLENTLLKYFK
ncbi:MAG: TlpA disulfide reductase family protein [Bacteroidota bacterium]